MSHSLLPSRHEFEFCGHKGMLTLVILPEAHRYDLWAELAPGHWEPIMENVGAIIDAEGNCEKLSDLVLRAEGYIEDYFDN